MMSAVLIKYWLRYRKKKRNGEKKKLVAVRVTDLCKSFLRFFGLPWFMNYSDINRQYANSRHTRVRMRAHTHAHAYNTHTPHTHHTHTHTPPQAKGEIRTCCYDTWTDFRAYLLDHFFELKCK